MLFIDIYKTSVKICITVVLYAPNTIDVIYVANIRYQI